MRNIYNNIALRSLNQVKTLNPIMYMSVRCFFEDFWRNEKYERLNHSFLLYCTKKSSINLDFKLLVIP